MNNRQSSINELFEPAVNYPDIEYKERLSELIGLDDHKARLTKILSLLINPISLEEWKNKYHSSAKKVISAILKRPPLVILEGDVGTGKSELALTIGDAVARQENVAITLLPLSLSARGQGLVGEMTKLLTNAFDHTIELAKKLKNQSRSSRGAVILLVDEADALTQSRESTQMHHEDKAGVNTFIRGIDRMGNGKLPAAVIMCTNRLGALDPAVKRRAADILTFTRPDKSQRHTVLQEPLKELGFSDKEIEHIVTTTGKRYERDYGFTFSDLTQRLLPSIVLDAYPTQKVNTNRAKEIAEEMTPTPPFNNIE